MTEFDIYQHPTKELEAIKFGFSWPGFFLGPIWLFVKGLWLYGLVILVAIIVVNTQLPELSIAFLIGVSVVVGLKGNGWRCALLEKHGCECLKRVEARDSDEVMAVATGFPCPECGRPYRVSDYRPDAEHIYCSYCKAELPRDTPMTRARAQM